MNSFAQTVNGPIKNSELGFTLMHEHIFCDLRKPRERNVFLNNEEGIKIDNRFEVNYYQNKHPQNLILDEYEKAVDELNFYREFGGNTIVELSTIGLNPEPKKLEFLKLKRGFLRILICILKCCRLGAFEAGPIFTYYFILPIFLCDE